MTSPRLLTALLGFAFAASAYSADVKVVNADAWFVEGPIWYQNKLF
jgi:gluconolactonase